MREKILVGGAGREEDVNLRREGGDMFKGKECWAERNFDGLIQELRLCTIACGFTLIVEYTPLILVYRAGSVEVFVEQEIGLNA